MEPGAVQQAIASYGYLAMFAGTFLEGETFFLLGGILARQGILDPWLVAVSAMAGGFVGDQFFFFLGRWRGASLLARSRSLARRAAKARRVVRRHALLLILCSRFLYGFRMVVPVACGTSQVHWLTFLVLNFISAIAWTVCFGGLGYWFGCWVSSNMDLITAVPKIIALVVAVVAATMTVGYLVRKRLLDEDTDRPSG